MEVLLIPLTAILMPLALVPTILVMKHRHERRKWEHLERLKSMETHLPVPSVHALAKQGGVAAIGAGVPMASVLAAFLTTITADGNDEVAVPAIAWGCAFLISALALATSLILAYMHRHASQQQQPDTVDALSNGKPAFDPDAFDVVSSRG